MDRDSAPQWAIALGAIVVAMLVASIGLVAAGGWTWFSRFLESAAPAWVQAIGSIAAIAAAAWLARDDRRVRRMDAKVAAELMLTRAEATLVHAISAITPVASHLLEGPMVQTPNVFATWRSMEASVDLPSQADLQVLWPLRRGLAQGLIRAFGAFNTARIALDHANPLGALDAELIVPQWQNLYASTRYARNTLILTLRQVEEALGSEYRVGETIPLTPKHPLEDVEPPDMSDQAHTAGSD